MLIFVLAKIGNCSKSDGKNYLLRDNDTKIVMHFSSIEDNIEGYAQKDGNTCKDPLLVESRDTNYENHLVP